MAVGEQVPLAAAERLLAPADLADLEARGLVVVVDAGGIEVVQIVHPLHREVLAAGLTRLRRRGVLEALVDAVRGLDRFGRDTDRADRR